MSTVSLQQFVGAHNALSGLDLAHAHFHFREIFDADFLDAFGRGSRTGSRRCACWRWRSCGRRGRRACGARVRFLLFFLLHNFHPLYRFGFVDAREQRLRLAQRRAGL